MGIYHILARFQGCAWCDQEYIRSKSAQPPIPPWYICFLKWCSNMSHVSMATILLFLHIVRGTSEKRLCSTGMTSKRLTKHVIWWDIVEAIRGEVPATFTEYIGVKDDFCCNVCWSRGIHGDVAATYGGLLFAPATYGRLLQGTAHRWIELRECERSYYASTYLATSLRIFMHYVRILIRLPCWRVTASF